MTLIIELDTVIRAKSDNRGAGSVHRVFLLCITPSSPSGVGRAYGATGVVSMARSIELAHHAIQLLCRLYNAGIGVYKCGAMCVETDFVGFPLRAITR